MAKAKYWVDPGVKDWNYKRRVRMARTPDNELRTTVIDVKSDGKRFRAAMEDGRVQEFTLSTQGFMAVPTVGDDIILKYNIQSSTNPKWPDPTFWANEIQPAAGGESAPPMQRDNNSPLPHIEREQPVPSAEAIAQLENELAALKGTDAAPVVQKLMGMTHPPQENRQIIKGGYAEEANTRERSTEWNTAVMTAREVLIANLEWCPKVDTSEQRHPITSEMIADMARDIYYGKEYPQHEDQGVEPQNVRNDDPGPVYQEESA